MFKINKIWMFLIGVMVTFSINSVCFGLKWGEWWDIIPSVKQTDSTPIINGQTILDDSIEYWSNTFSKKAQWILQLPQSQDYNNSLSYVMALIQIAINWTLWMLAVVALVYLLYCGFLVFTSWSDDKNASKWKKWIYTAWIALAGVWLSWMIISAIIRFINLMANRWIGQ